MSILSGLTMLIPLVVGGIKAISAVKKAKTIVDAAEMTSEGIR
jgi:hypothetical protein